MKATAAPTAIGEEAARSSATRLRPRSVGICPAIAGAQVGELATARHVAAQRREGDAADDQRQPEEDHAVGEHGRGRRRPPAAP